MKRILRPLILTSLLNVGILTVPLFAVSTVTDPFTPPNIAQPVFKAAKCNVRDFGAKGDGVANDTQAINRAIEKCNADGGGDILFPAGTYSAASIHLRSNVRFMLDPKAVITGADSGYDKPEPNPFDKYQDFGHSHFHNALMWGENLENFAIVGGRVDGGHIITGEPKGRDIGDKVIAIRVGRNLLFKNVTHETGGHFVYLLNDCENITISNVTIKKSRDALDLMGCRNVQVYDCHFTGCGDDTLGIKSDYALGRKIATENIYAWNCYFESGCNGLQFGSETAGDFRNINIWNIQIGLAMKAGIGITCNDGGVIDGVNYRDITMHHAATPIYLLITDRLRTGDPGKKIGTIRNVKISNVVATEVVPGSHHGPANPATISGRPEASLENITLEAIKIVYKGGGSKAEADIVPPYPKDYSPKSLGVRPASAFYIRHVKGLTLKNVECLFEAPDARPPIVASDVDGLVFDTVNMARSSQDELLRLERVSGFTVNHSPGLADRKEVKVEKIRE